MLHYRIVLTVSLLFLISTNKLVAQWVQINGPSGAYAYAITAVENRLFAICTNGIHTSTDQGSSWNKEVYNGLPGPEAYYVAFAGNDTNMYCATNKKGSFCSIDKGANWLQVSLPTNGGLRSLTKDALYIQSDLFQLGTLFGFLKHSTDNGKTWAEVGYENSMFRVYAIATNGAELFAVADENGLYLSTNNGGNWILLDTKIPPLPRALAVIDFNVFTRTKNSVFYSTIFDTTCIEVNEGLPGNPPVNIDKSLVICGAELFTISGGKIWKRPLSEMVILPQKVLDMLSPKRVQ